MSGRVRARRLAVGLAALCIFWAILVWLRRREAVAVVITTDRATVSPGGQAHLEATLRKKRNGELVESRGCTFRWSTTMGEVWGSGTKVDWNAPSISDTTSTITARARCESESYEGAIDLVTPPAPDSPDFARQRSSSDPSPPRAMAAAAPQPAQTHQGDGAPIIDSITVEKTSLCRGEDNQVTVRAHDPKGADDKWLHVLIDGHAGASQPLPYWSSEGQMPRKVAVYGKNNASVTYADVPPVTVLDCLVPQWVQVVHELVPNTEDTFRFLARVIPKGKPDKVEACSFEWDFGDGASATTQDAWTEHAFLDRPQDGLESVFQIRVRVLPCDGGSPIIGRAAIALTNIYAMEKEAKHVSGLVVVADPRYPERGNDGVVRQTALIRTWERDPVHITRVSYTDTIPTNGFGAPTEPTAVSAASFLGTTTVGREWVRVPVSYDTKQEPNWAMRRWEIEGTASDGTPVYGSFTLMNPPKLDPEKSPKVTDPAFKERLLAAMKILGRDQVSDEDLMRLEEEGKLPPSDPRAVRPVAQPPPGFAQPVSNPSPASQQPPRPAGPPAAMVPVTANGGVPVGEHGAAHPPR